MSKSADLDVKQLVKQLRKLLRGPVHLPGEPGYLQSTSGWWNASLNAQVPSFVVHPTGTHDVVACVRFFTAHNIDFTVACGQHSSAFARVSGCAMLDLHALMRSVTVDRERALAFVSGGAKNADFDHACALYGLHAPAGSNPDTGVGGLALGGGLGHLSRALGLTLDCVTQVEVVTADARVLVANREQNADLFWAVRGAGFNFGVVTQFVVQLHPVGACAESVCLLLSCRCSLS